jgi:hypothetical protein
MAFHLQEPLMTGTTISTTLHSTVTLGTDGFTSPLTITSEGGVEPKSSGVNAVDMPVPGGMIDNAGQLSGAMGSHGGIGIDLTASGTVNNTGFIDGGNAAVASGYGTGGNGGAAIVLANGGMVTNEGQIFGGRGGRSNYGKWGNGGAGIVMTGGDVLNQGAIAGGYSSVGGNNGAGIVMSGGTVINQSYIFGGGSFLQAYPSKFSSAGGDGISQSSAGMILNHGVILSGSGSNGGASGVGVALASGGSLINYGYIQGYRSLSDGIVGSDGVVLRTASELVNYGSIVGGGGGPISSDYLSVGGVGVVMMGRGTLINDGEIKAGDEAVGTNLQSAGLVINRGTLIGGVGLADPSDAGNGGNGLDAAGGLTLLNTGLITAGAGNYASGRTFNGLAADGISVSGIGSIKNTGVISGSVGGGQGKTYEQGTGGVGIYLDGGTLYNSGTIAGGNDAAGTLQGALGDAVQFGSLAATLIIAPGAHFVGDVAASTTATDVLELSGTSTENLTGIGSQFVNFQDIKFASGADWTIEGNKAGLASHENISGFTSGDAIILDDFVATSHTFVSGTGLILRLGSATETIDIAGSFTTADFSISTYDKIDTRISLAGDVFASQHAAITGPAMQFMTPSAAPGFFEALDGFSPASLASWFALPDHRSGPADLIPHAPVISNHTALATPQQALPFLASTPTPTNAGIVAPGSQDLKVAAMPHENLPPALFFGQAT